ncbi:outer membrane beta-barrel protein [Dyadobacter sp. CY323]|uniref:outer membrane beta-barrel protein n=1 Tax=Dyadobacter sp. CY323 TaxID=2907302 RepID=UPI001F285514|nr:outer membrane beta-barrel protein [Dyadobacter sp. CY323]MCE6992447.1 outer membrane beta-barrel protein [Dyadobacter sp. CY323]
MKPFHILLLSSLLITSSVNAQQTHAFRKFGAGIYGGPQLFGKIFTNTKLDDISGITAGLDIRYALSKQPQGFSLHFQPSYNSFRLFTSEGANTQLYRERTWKWEAFHFPLLARYTFSSGWSRPFAEVGPTLRIRKALTIRNAGYGCGVAGCSGGDITTDLDPITNNDPIVLTAAAGVEIDIWKITIPISVRLQQGFGTYEMKEQREDALYYDKLKTNTIQVTAGVSF